MMPAVPVQDRLFTTRYRRCRCHLDNAYVNGNKMAVVPGGLVFVSNNVTQGKVVMFCKYESAPTEAQELIPSNSNVRFDDIKGIAFTGSLLVIAAEGNLEEDMGDLGFYGFCWQGLCEGRVNPIRLHVYNDIKMAENPVTAWGSIAGASHSLAILETTNMFTMSDSIDENDAEDLELVKTVVPLQKSNLVALSSAQPQVIAVAGGTQMAVSSFSSPESFNDEIATLPKTPQCIAVSDNGQMIAIGYSTGLVQIWDSRDLKKPIVSVQELGSECCCLTFSGSASDRLFAAAKDSSEVLVIDTRFFAEHQKIWLPAIPRPSETLSRYDLRTALWPESKDVYELPTSRPESYITPIIVGDICWLDKDGVLAMGTSEGILFIQCGHRSPLKSVEWM